MYYLFILCFLLDVIYSASRKSLDKTRKYKHKMSEYAFK